MLQHPIYLIIISLFIIGLIITESMQKELILKKRLIIAFLNLVVWIVAIFFYNRISTSELLNNIYLGLTGANYLFFLITIYTTFKTATFRASHYQLFIRAIKNSRWNAYYVVDQKERIKDMSASLLAELNLEKEEVLGKKLFDIFNRTIRFIKLNDKEINNRMLESYYETFKKNALPNEIEVEELQLQNYNGEIVVFHFVVQPIFTLGKYKGRICVGEKKTDQELLAVEKTLKQTDLELESIRQKFIATLELSDEGIFYIDLDNQTIWFNDTIVNQLNLSAHEISLKEYRSLIDADDLKKYLTQISDLTVNKQNYQASYRITIDEKQMWIKEKGKRLFEDRSSNVIMGVLTPIKGAHFRKSGIDLLDEIKDENYLLADLKQLIKRERPFQLALIRMQNVPKINEVHGREVGNMIMGHYIQKINETFITESSSLYRTTGLEFAFTITDPRKMAALKTGIDTKENFLNLTMNYGSIQVELEVFIGIATMYEDAKTPQELYQAAHQALKTAGHPNFSGHGIYYKDIKS